MPEVMVMYLDDDELPRAYAVGPVADQVAVEAEAKRQLFLYLSMKLVDGIPAPPGYTKDIVIVRSDNDEL